MVSGADDYYGKMALCEVVFKDDSAIHGTEKKIIKQQILVIFVKVQCVLHIEKCIENYNKTCHKSKLAKYNYPASNLRRDSF